eukprot:scaffold9457_cov86-Cyclotella_meneghiniana.AAC.3
MFREIAVFVQSCLHQWLEGRDSLMFADEPSLLPVTLPPPDPAPPHRPSRISLVSPHRALQCTLGTLLVVPANAIPSVAHLPELCPSRVLAQQLLLLIGSLFILHEWRQQFQKLSVSFSGITAEVLEMVPRLMWNFSSLDLLQRGIEFLAWWFWSIWLSPDSSVLVRSMSWLPILLLGCFTSQDQSVTTSPEPQLHAPPWPSISADYIVDRCSQWFTLPEGADPASDFDQALLSSDCPLTSAFDSLLDDYVFSIQSLSPSLFSLTEAGYDFSVNTVATEFVVPTGNWRSKRSALRHWIKRHLPTRTLPRSPVPSPTQGCPSVHPSAVACFGSFCHCRPDFILQLGCLFTCTLSWTSAITSDGGANVVASPFMSRR